MKGDKKACDVCGNIFVKKKEKHYCCSKKCTNLKSKRKNGQPDNPYAINTLPAQPKFNPPTYVPKIQITRIRPPGTEIEYLFAVRVRYENIVKDLDNNVFPSTIGGGLLAGIVGGVFFPEHAGKLVAGGAVLGAMKSNKDYIDSLIKTAASLGYDKKEIEQMQAFEETAKQELKNAITRKCTELIKETDKHIKQTKKVEKIVNKLKKEGKAIERYFVIHPFARWRYKYWNSKRFAEVSDAIAERCGWTPIWTTSPDKTEIEYIHEMKNYARVEPLLIEGTLTRTLGQNL